jgi:MFS family permease
MSLPPAPTSPNQVQHPHRPGSARAAFAYPEFRRMWFASFASSIGTWMQNVVLPKYVLDRTGSTAAVGLIVFAQLGPLLFLSIPAGVVADRFDRRRWLVAMQIVQLAFSAALAPLASSHAEMWAIYLVPSRAERAQRPCVSAMLPTLVGRCRPRRSSAMMNGSRGGPDHRRGDGDQ